MGWRILLFGLCCAARPLLALQGFEGGLGNWSTAGLWQRVSSPACVTPHAGSACLYFGRGGACNYDDHQVKDASVTSGPVNLTDPARAFVSFWMLYQVESDSPACYDELRLELSYDNANWALLQKLSSGTNPPGSAPTVGLASGGGLAGTPQWVYRRVDLSAYLGLSIYLRFRFVSSGTQAGESLCGPPDSAFDAFLGYALDDINFYDDPEPVSLVKSVAPAYGGPGTDFTYTLVCANKDSVARDLSLWDSLPMGVNFVSANPAPLSQSGQAVDWGFSAVPAGAAITVSLAVQSAPAASVPQDWYNTAWAQSTAAGLTATSVAILYKLRTPGLQLHKSVDRPVTTNGDEITYTLLVQNFSAVTQSALVLQELPPVGFLMRGSGPALATNGQWSIGALLPGEVRAFSLWGPIFGNDGQDLVNNAQLQQSGAVAAYDSASIKVIKPIEPQVWLRGLYPNPAPGENPAFGEALHIGYELNQTMPMTIDIFTLAGEKVRSLAVDGTRGTHDAVWDLKNAWGNGVASGVYAVRVWGDAKVRPLPEAVGFAAVLR